MIRQANAIRRSERGFTLVELIAASALAAVLCLAGMSVVASLGRTQRAFDRDEQAQIWNLGLEELIARDLRCAARVEAGENRLALDTYTCIDPQTRQTLPLLVHVVYRLGRVRDRSLLIREQSPVDADPSAKTSVDLVCA